MKSFLYLFIITVALANSHHVSAQIQMSRSVMANGGERASNNQFMVAGTIGQLAVETATNNAGQVEAGFWPQASLEPVAVESLPDNLPREFRLDQNYPNPFNPSTTILFALPKASSATLKIFDVSGRETATLINERFEAGEHRVIFNALGLTSGVYFYQLRAGDYVQQRKLVVVK